MIDQVVLRQVFRVFFCCIGLVGTNGWGDDAIKGVRLIGRVEISGTSSDRSGLQDTLEQGVPHQQFGGISAVEHLEGDRYLLLADRGPGDGANSYHCRFHLCQIRIDSTATQPVAFALENTLFLTDAHGVPFNGNARFHSSTDSLQPRRYDPEGIRRLGTEELVISEEYGPTIDRFNRAGRWLGSLPVPKQFAIEQSSEDPNREASQNAYGRQPNGGFEGLAVTPNGKVFALVQRPLIQDSDPAESGSDKRVGVCCRLLKVDPVDGSTAQYVYELDEPGLGQSALLAISETTFLVFERDSKRGNKSKSKRIYKIDISDASDVSGIEQLPASGTPDSVTASRKSLFLDFLDPKLGLKLKQIPGKIEGLAFGPDLPDGSRSLIVISDNDFLQDEPTCIYVFACSEKSLR